MARKNYPEEFKRDAVALYRDTEGATITVIAELNDGVPAGERVNHKRMARVMRSNGIAWHGFEMAAIREGLRAVPKPTGP